MRATGGWLPWFTATWNDASSVRPRSSVTRSVTL